ncbi:MAG: NAD-binding protein [Bryobacteraceae bacterium]
MQASIRKIVQGSSVFAVCCVVAVIGYVMAGWTLLEAVYMVTITTFGVGYGEVRPILDPGLRIFTIAIIIVGCSSLIYVTGGFIQMLTEGEIDRVLGTHRRTKGINRLAGHAIVCGFGRVGRILATELRQARQAFVVVDADPARIKDAEALGYLVVTGNATEEAALEDAGVARARVLASVLPDDAKNVFITLTARELNPKIEIIARAENPATERKLIASGATRVVLPSAIGALRICQLITNPSAEEILSRGRQQLEESLGLLGLSMSEAELAPGSALIGARRDEIHFPASGQVLLVGIIRANGEVLREPPADTVLAERDRLVFVSASRDAPVVQRRSREATGLMFRGVKS